MFIRRKPIVIVPGVILILIFAKISEETTHANIAPFPTKPRKPITHSYKNVTPIL